MVFYLRGLIDLQDELVAGFFDRAAEATRQHAMRFIGRVLYDNGDLEATLKARAIALWESRTADLDVAAFERRLEIGAFGWWFAASSLDARWRITQLERGCRGTRWGAGPPCSRPVPAFSFRNIRSGSWPVSGG